MFFIHEWKELRPIGRSRLISKPLQLPLSCELCYLNETPNHETGGLLRGGSSRRKTPLADIGNSLPPNATWREVALSSAQKKKIYIQAWSDMDEPLCKLCQTPCKGRDATVPQFFEDLFCCGDCFEEYRSRTSNIFLRQGLFQIEHGICTNCQLNCHRLVKHLRVLSLEKMEAYIKKVAPNIAKNIKMLAKLAQDPMEGNAWHADHIIPVYKGGERHIARKKAKKQLKETISDLINTENSRKNVLKKCDSEFRSSILDDDLLIELLGSSYSAPNMNTSNKQSSSQHISCESVFDHDKSCQEPRKHCDPNTTGKNQES